MEYGSAFSRNLKRLEKAGEIGKIPVSVGLDTWDVDYVLLDEKGEPIDGAYCYRDSRTEEIIEKVHNKLSFAELYEKTGIAFHPFNTVYQLFCDKQSGRMKKAASFLMLPDYFHFLLTGVRSMQKALLFALLMPNEELKKLQDENNFTKIMYLNEKFKTMPIGDVWEEYLIRQGLNDAWFEEVEKFENEVIVKRI